MAEDLKAIIPIQFFLCVFTKDRVYIPRIHSNLPDFKHKTEEAITFNTPDLLRMDKKYEIIELYDGRMPFNYKCRYIEHL